MKSLYNYILEKKETRYIKHRNGHWVVISAKTGKPWPGEYKTADDAKAALAAYHIHGGC